MIDDPPYQRQTVLGRIQKKFTEGTLCRRCRNELQVHVVERFREWAAVFFVFLIVFRQQVVGGEFGKLFGCRLRQRAAELQKLAQRVIAIGMLAQGFQILCREMRRVIAEQEKACSKPAFPI